MKRGDRIEWAFIALLIIATVMMLGLTIWPWVIP